MGASLHSQNHVIEKFGFVICPSLRTPTPSMCMHTGVPTSVGTFAETPHNLRRKYMFSVDGNGRSAVVGALTPCATGSWNRQRSLRGDDVLRRQAMAVVDVDIGAGDAAILCDDESRRQR
jgi:hypothetical protein